MGYQVKNLWKYINKCKFFYERYGSGVRDRLIIGVSPMRNINDANRLTRMHSHKHHHLYSHNILTIGLCVKVTKELRQWCDSVPPSIIFEKSTTLVQGPVLIKTLASLAIYSYTRCVYILMHHWRSPFLQMDLRLCIILVASMIFIGQGHPSIDL